MLLLVLALLWFQVAPAQIPPAEAVCHANGLLPDAACTPGAVTSATLDQVCTPGYAEIARRRLRNASAVKRQRMAAYGLADQPARLWTLDHLVAIEIGGSPTSALNLWPEPVDQARVKDRVEDASHDAVCRGDLDLATAQQWMAGDWIGLGQSLGVLPAEGS